MSTCDISRINHIESTLKNNPSNVSNNDLFYYLHCKSNNKELNTENLDDISNYLQKINTSFYYENIFVNSSNYVSILIYIIGLALPFYFMYPRFYKIGFLGVLIGFGSFLMLYAKMNSMYSTFFKKIGIIYLCSTIVFYLVFFILLNKLNHITLFFISAIICYLIINYVCKVTLTIPTKNNPYNKFRATLNNNSGFTEYNVLIETACFQVIQRYNLTLPSGNMLYSYLTEFSIIENGKTYTDFFTNLFGPFLSLFILWLLQYFLFDLKYNTSTELINNISGDPDNINMFPIIGLTEESYKYITCQANYILPKEFNVDLLIHKLIDKYDFNNKMYSKVEKALIRISKELLLKYNPKFSKIENENENNTKKIILENIKDNKIYKNILYLLKKNQFEYSFDMNYIDEIKKIIHDEPIAYKEKEEMYDLLNQINNILVIENEFNQDYENDSILARDELLYDKEIDPSFKKTLKEIIDKYIKNFTDNLNLKKETLFGYDYNITFYHLLNNKSRLFSNQVFKIIIGFISTWILFAKPLNSSWMLSKYIMTSKYGFTKLLKNMCSQTTLSKYFSLGLDTVYFQNKYNELVKNNENTFINKGFNLFYTVLVFLIVCPLLYFYNSNVFGMTSVPSWFTLLYQAIFIINILGNIYCHNQKISYLLFNIIFFILFVSLVIISTIIIYLIKK
jgi:hypothetical protein